MIKGLHDVDLINSVYRIEAIRKRIEHDHWQPQHVANPAAGYLGAWHHEVFCGFFMIREVSSIDIEIHACLLPQSIPHSRVLGIEVLERIFTASSVRRVSAPIIGDLVSAMNYVGKLGFRREGVLRNACERNGQSLDVHLFGMTRDEFAERFHGRTSAFLSGKARIGSGADCSPDRTCSV